MPIGGPVDAALQELQPVFGNRPLDLTEENIQSRMRGVYLMAVHREAGWLLTAAVRIGSPWVYVQATPEHALRARVLPTLVPNLLLALALLASIVAGQWALQRSFVRPALAILDYLRALSADAEAAAPRLGGRWQGWIAAVTETFHRQRELQQRERQTEALKAAIIDHAIAGIVSTDGQGRIVEFNPAAEAMFGRSRAEVLGRAVGDADRAAAAPRRPRRRHGAHGRRRRAADDGPARADAGAARRRQRVPDRDGAVPHRARRRRALHRLDERRHRAHREPPARSSASATRCARARSSPRWAACWPAWRMS